MSVPTSNPVAFTYTSPDGPANTGSTAKSIPHPPKMSMAVYTIAGIRVTVYGLAELPPGCREVTVLWLLHPRLQTESCMAPFASHFISMWNEHRLRHTDTRLSSSSSPSPSPSPSKTTTPKQAVRGLIAVSFDQRNHGTREVHPLSNEAWRSGNETHAQDMFSSYHGTALDAALLLDYLPAYVFPSASTKIVDNVVLGISLGGHAAWHCVLHDPRVTAAIVVIGCPDYVRLMSDRARLSRRKTFTATNPPGATFVGSSDFPPGLLDVVRKWDPAALLMNNDDNNNDDGTEEKLKKCLGGKRILNLAGGADKLVPYAACCRPFLDWLKRTCAPDSNGVFADGNLKIEDIIVPGAGHEVPPEMVRHMERFLLEVMSTEILTDAGDKEAMEPMRKGGRRDSRI